MVATRPKAVARKGAAAQAESPPKQNHAAARVCGRRGCLSLSLVAGNGEDSGCRRCEQVDDLLCLVAALTGEVES